MLPSFGRKNRARREVVLQPRSVERRRHDDDLEIGTPRFRDVEDARERDVAVEMPLVKLVEEDG